MKFLKENFHIFIVFLLHFSRVLSAPTTRENDIPLLVVSYDAFRPEYLSRGITPALNEFRSKGITAQFLANVFPTKTLVNHHTISVVHRNIIYVCIQIWCEIFIDRASIQKHMAWQGIHCSISNLVVFWETVTICFITTKVLFQFGSPIN